MSCADFVRRLQVVLDQRLDPQQDATLIQHAQHCSACRDRLDAEERLFVALAASASQWCVGPHRLADHGIDLSAPVPRTNPLRLATFAFASSLALLLAVMIGWPSHSDAKRNAQRPPTQLAAATTAHSPKPRSNGASAQPSGPTALAELQNSAERTEPSRGLAEAPSHATMGAAGGLNVANRLNLERISLAGQAERLSNLYEIVCKSPPLPDSSIPQVDQLADEFLPIAQPFVAVLHVLRRSIPSAAKSPPPRRDDTSWLIRTSDVA